MEARPGGVGRRAVTTDGTTTPPLAELTSVQDAQVLVARLLEVTRAAYVRSSQLQQALDSRVAIEQAKGVLAERYGLALHEAFELLRRAARAKRVKLSALAETVVRSAETPPEITTLLE
jgi:AmiR/NasT family two-component response regulator